MWRVLPADSRIALLAITGLGCLDSPPAVLADGGQGKPDARLGDANPTRDAASCVELAHNNFDNTTIWDVTSDPDTTVVPEQGSVFVSSTPGEATSEYADLHTVDSQPISRNELTVELVIDQSVGGKAGISWHNSASDHDYFDLGVADGVLYARRKPRNNDEADVCLGTCPPYSSTEHARLRLREDGGVVLFQTAPLDGEWVDVGIAPAADFTYATLLYAQAIGPGVAEMNVTGAEWVDCGE